jgi:glycosyltransferase involved in cell wall biosynthesis
MTVVHVLEPFVSGVSTAVINITEQLSEMKHMVVHGSRVLVDDVENVRNKFPRGTEFVEWKSVNREIRAIRDFRALRELLGILKPYRKNTETVIHLHSSKAGFLGRLACRLLGISPVIYTPHCAAFIRTDIGFLKRRLFRCLERIGGWFGGRVVGCGKSEAVLYSQLGKPAVWVSNGVHISAGTKDTKPDLISFSGVVSRQKNPALFNAIALAFEDEAVPFCWIGEGPLRDRLSSKNINVTGWVDKKMIDTYLGKTKIYLSASSWEGLPFGVLEAMNRSCALLLHDVPGNRDLVIPGENGYLFTRGQEAVELLRDMLKNTEKTLAMGKQSRTMAVSGYSIEKMGEGYRNIYTALLSGRGLQPCH